MLLLPLRHSLLLSLLHTLFFRLLLSPVRGGVTTVNIDDENGDPVTGNKITYSPDGVWNYGPTCGGCSSKPDPSQVYEGSWHDGAYFQRDNAAKVAQVFFTGTAVTVFGILSHGTSGAATDITFYIDGAQAGHYSQTDIDGNGFDYNYSFFSTSSLDFKEHNLTIVNGGNLGADTSLLLLDYIQYSYDATATSSSSPQASQNVAKVATTSSTTSSESTTTSSSRAASSSTTTVSKTSTSQSNTTSVSPSNSSNHTQTTGTLQPLSSNGSFASSGVGGVSPQSTSPVNTSTVTSTNASALASSPKSNIGLIVGSVLGSLVFLSLLFLFIFLLLRSRRQRNKRRIRVLLPNPLPASATSIPLIPERSEKAAFTSIPENTQTDSGSSSQGSTHQTQTHTGTSDRRSRMINDVMTLAAEVQRLVGQISQEADGHPGSGEAEGSEEEEGEEGGGGRGGSLPPPYSPSDS